MASAVVLCGVTMLDTAVRAGAAPSGGTASFELDGVNLTLTSPVLPGRQFVTSEPGSASQVASSSALSPYREVIVIAVPFGTSPATEKLPHAQAGDQQSYRSSLIGDRSSQGAHPSPGPEASLFGQNTSGVFSSLSLHLDGPQLKPTVIVEWVAQAGPRTWVLRISQQVTAGEDANQLVDGLSGITLTSSDPNQPSSLPSSSPQPQTSPPATPSPTAPNPSPSTGLSATPTGAVTDSFVRPAAGAEASVPNQAPAPPWWSGTCDSNHNPGSFPLGSSYDGVAACGPRPIAGATDFLVNFYPGAWGEYEWECVELVMRYLYLVDGVAPYSANGSQVVWNYSGSALTRIGNGTAGEAPIPGDILSYGSTSTNGHASIVSSSTVGSDGNGTITVVEQNNTTNGTTTMQVSNWQVQGNPYPVSGWLQVSGPGNVQELPAPVGQSDGVVDVFWRASDGSLGHSFYLPGGGWSGSQSFGGLLASDPSAVSIGGGYLQVVLEGVDANLWGMEYRVGPGWSGFGNLGMGPLGGAPRAVSGQPGVVDAFWRGADNGLWHAWLWGATWYGPQQLAPAGSVTSDPAPVALGENGYLDVFWRGTDNNLWDVQYRGQWSSPQNLGMGPLGSQPEGVNYQAGDVDVAWAGTDQNIWYAVQTPGGLRGPVSGGDGPLASYPELASGRPGDADLFWEGSNSQAWYASQSGGGTWSGAGALPSGFIGSQPVPTASSPGVLDVFWRGQDGGLWHAWGYNGGWAGPQSLAPGGSFG